MVSRRLYFTPSSFDLPDLPAQERWVPAISIDRSERGLAKDVVLDHASMRGRANPERKPKGSQFDLTLYLAIRGTSH